MKIGDIVIHKYWNRAVLLVGHWIDASREYWEVYVDGDMELVKARELEKINENR